MMRPNTYANRSSASNSPSKTKQTSDSASPSHTATTTTIREIRSRTLGSTGNARQLLINRRQAESMERLNSNNNNQNSPASSAGDKDKTSSPSSNGSPSSGASLNRTASRVSRFRNAKAVFEKLSSTSNSSSAKPERPPPPEKPKGTVASRFAAAAAARAANNNNNNNHTTATANSRPRVYNAQATQRNAEATKASSGAEAHSDSAKLDVTQPKPQPRVISAKTEPTSIIAASSSSKDANSPKGSAVSLAAAAASLTQQQQQAKVAPQTRAPPKDLIDKIVLEIANDHALPDANCTIQDLSNCDISGIPDTLDFDRCFQDVEMMTEEEARQLLSRKTSEPLASTCVTITSGNHSQQADANMLQPTSTISINSTQDCHAKCSSDINANVQQNVVGTLQPKSSSIASCDEAAKLGGDTPTISAAAANCSLISFDTNDSQSSCKAKVRFSDEPVQIYNTHAVEDYDRRNDDIDPVAASAEYEIEKCKEREGIKSSDSEDESIERSASKTTSENLVIHLHCGQAEPSVNPLGNLRDTQDSSILRGVAAHHAPLGQQDSSNDVPTNLVTETNCNNAKQTPAIDEAMLEAQNDYIKSLEREVNLKGIIEQNLRDLQCQYYEAVKELDDYKSETEARTAKSNQQCEEANTKLESAQTTIGDLQEQINDLNKQINDIKESSQLLEKKYHRAKRIIKDMQSREQSFNRREQLYQQKLDEIEHELGVLIESMDGTIFDEALSYFSLIERPIIGNNLPQQKQAKLDVFGLLKRMLDNFNANGETHNPQIKQRVVAILEQKLANLIAKSKNSTSIYGSVKCVNDNGTGALGAQFQPDSSRPFASHRLSHPIMPHPVGLNLPLNHLPLNIGQQPINNENSPPQSVNSFPSTNSLTSLTMNNNNNNNNNNLPNNNTLIMPTKTKDALPDGYNAAATNVSESSSLLPQQQTSEADRFPPNTATSFQTGEWHDKPVSEWTTTQVSTWLLALGLDQYITKFEDRNVNGHSLLNLDSTVLKGLGVLNNADRNLLKKKIRELRAEMEKERKLIEKRLKESLKDKTKNKGNNNAGASNNSGNNNNNNKSNTNNDTKSDGFSNANSNKSSWKKSLLS